MIDFHLDFTYENSDKKVLNNVAGKVEKGRCVVFCGKSAQSYVLLKWSWNDLILAALTIGAVIFGLSTFLYLTPITIVLMPVFFG